MRIIKQFAALNFAICAGFSSTASAQSYGTPMPPDFGAAVTPHIIGGQITGYVITAILGFLIGALFSDRLKQFRRYVWFAIAGLVILTSFVAPFPMNAVLSFPVAIVIFIITIALGLAWGRLASRKGRSTTFGSAKWADAEHLQQGGLIGEQGLALGYFDNGSRSVESLFYKGDRHLLTVAPTRSGKGVAGVIPNLLTYAGSTLVIDPKGENAMICARQRADGLRQKVHIVDPWGLTEKTTGIPAARFNPIDWIASAGPEAGENAMILADSLVPLSSGSKDPFWDEESKSVLMGFSLHVATAPQEEGQRHLGRVRDMLMLKTSEFDQLMDDMLASSNPIVVGTAARCLSKDAKLMAGVLSSAQSHTHFLDSPALRDSLSRSDFSFEDLKREPTSIFLVLPADRLDTFGRWLRILIQQALTVSARNIETKPKLPVLFMLDEMAALGRLTMVEQAFSLMAGFGIQCWGHVQDLAMIARIYGQDGWQTFIGNAGVLQYFGSRDKMTAEYFESLCGVATVPTLSSTVARSFAKGGESGSSSQSYGEASRKLVMADELMRIGKDRQLLLVENLDPIAARKINWYKDSRYKELGVNLQKPRAVSELAPPASSKTA